MSPLPLFANTSNELGFGGWDPPETGTELPGFLGSSASVDSNSLRAGEPVFGEGSDVGLGVSVWGYLAGWSQGQVERSKAEEEKRSGNTPPRLVLLDRAPCPAREPKGVFSEFEER